MFFSVNEFHNAVHSDDQETRHLRHFRAYNKKELAELLRRVKQGIVRRDSDCSTAVGSKSAIAGYSFYLYKWERPWNIVPKLRNFVPPAGDFGVGVEVEMGFNSRTAASDVVSAIRHWKHIAIDYEGGTHGVEATFPPVLYSKFGKRSQVSRYLQLLAERFENCCVHHAQNQYVGTHVNVSHCRDANGSARVNGVRLNSVNTYLSRLSHAQNVRYFGRDPYRLGMNQSRWIEWKLFNSVTNWKVLRRYVDIAVSLTALVAADTEITQEAVMAALDAGYNKHGEI